MNDGIGVIRENEDLYQYIDGEINGKVKYINSNSEVFEGQYKNGIKTRLSKEYLKNDLIFEGEYLNGKKKWKRKRILQKWKFKI